MAATTATSTGTDMLGVPSTSLPLPLQDAAASSSTLSSHDAFHNQSGRKSSIRATRSVGSLRTLNSSAEPPDNDDDHSHSHSLSQNKRQDHHHHHQLQVGSFSPPPDLSFSRSSLLLDQEAAFLARDGGVDGSLAAAAAAASAPYSSQHVHYTRDTLEHDGHGNQHQHVHISSGNDSSWGSRHSANMLGGNNIHGSNSNMNSFGRVNMKSKPSNSRIRLDSVFGTQLPGFPYLNSAAAATSSALGGPLHPHHHHHHHFSSSSSMALNQHAGSNSDLLRGRASYNWSERSASAASQHGFGTTRSRSRAATSNSMRSLSGRDSATSLGQHHQFDAPAAATAMGAPSSGVMQQQGHARTASAMGEVDTSCSGGSNSSDEVDLDLSFDMDLLRTRQMQQLHARQQRQYQQQAGTMSQTSNEGGAKQGRKRTLSSSGAGGQLKNSHSGHVGIDMQSDDPHSLLGEQQFHQQIADASVDPAAVAAVDQLLGLPQPESDEQQQQRRYLLGGKKRLSRSAVELRANATAKARASALSASISQMPSSSLPGSQSATPRGGTPIQGLRGTAPGGLRSSSNQMYTFRQPGTLSATVVRSDGGGIHHPGGASKTSLDLTVDMPPLEYEDTSGDDSGNANNSSSNFTSSLGWSFATTPPLSPAEIVTFAESSGGRGSNISSSSFMHGSAGEGGGGLRRNSAGAGGILEHKSSAGNLLRKRRPSFPLMSLIDKAIRAPVASIISSGHATHQHQHHGGSADEALHSPDSDRSWGSPTPTQDNPTMIQIQQYDGHANAPMHEQRQQQYQHPDRNAQAERHTYEPSNGSLSAFTSSPDMGNEPLPPPPPLHDPAFAMESSPSSSVGTPGTMSPDLGTSQSGFSSPRSPDDIPTPRTGDFAIVDGNRFSQFSMTSASVGGLSFRSGSDTVEAGGNKRESRIFGLGLSSSGAATNNGTGVGGGDAHSPPPPHHLHLDAIPEQGDSEQNVSPRKSTSASTSSVSSGSHGSSSVPPSSSLNSAGATHSGAGPASSAQNGGGGHHNHQQQHKRQSSSLFRFPFVSSLRNPFTSRPATPSVATANLHNPNHSPSSSQESPATSNEELLSDAALGTAAAVLAGAAVITSSSSRGAADKEGKRSNSPNSSDGSHFQTSSSSDPPSPPRPGATSRAEAAIDPSMLRAGPNTGKGRLAGLGLTFGLPSFSNHNAHQPSQQNQTRRTSGQSQNHNHHQQRQSSLPVLSFSAASDDHSGAGGQSIESEEAAIQEAPRQSLERPPRARVSSNASHRSVSRDRRVNGYPASAPATTVHFNHGGMHGLDGQVERLHADSLEHADRVSSQHDAQQRQQHSHHKRPRTRLLSHGGLDLRGRLDRMRPSQLLFLAAFIMGPWCFVIGGWCLRPLDGDHRLVKGVRCRCPDASDTCECKAEVYRQIKLSGGRADLVLQMQNGEPHKMDRFVLANRIAALTCGTASLVLSITALIVLGRAW